MGCREAVVCDCMEGPVRTAALWLDSQGICCDRDFVGLCDLDTLPGAEAFPCEALAFMESLTCNVLLPDIMILGREAPSCGPPAKESLFTDTSLSLDIAATTPKEALKRLSAVVSDMGRESWAKKARVAAILGNCPRSLSSMRSG